MNLKHDGDEPVVGSPPPRSRMLYTHHRSRWPRSRLRFPLNRASCGSPRRLPSALAVRFFPAANKARSRFRRTRTACGRAFRRRRRRSVARAPRDLCWRRSAPAPGDHPAGPAGVDDATDSCRRPTRGWKSENNESGPFRVPPYQDLMRIRPSFRFHFH